MPSISRLAIEAPSVRCPATPAVRMAPQKRLARGAITTARTASATTSSTIVNPASGSYRRASGFATRLASMSLLHPCLSVLGGVIDRSRDKPKLRPQFRPLAPAGDATMRERRDWCPDRGRGGPMPESRTSELIARIDERRAKVVVVGQGYVGLPVAMRAAEVGFPVVGYDVARRPGRCARRRALVRRRRLRRAARRRARLRVHADARSERTARLRRRGDHGARRRCARTSRISRSSRRPPTTSHPGCDRARWSCSSRRRIPGRPTSCCARSSSQAACASSAGDFFLGYSPERIDPGNAEWNFVNTAKVVSGFDAASLRGRRSVLRRAGRQDRAGRLDRRGRAREAPREHVPPRQHRARERARDVRTRPRRRHLVGDRRGGDEALRVHAVHARSGCRWPLPAGRPRVPRVAGRAPDRATASGSWSSQTT